MKKALHITCVLMLALSMLLGSFQGALAQGGKVETPLEARKAVFATAELYQLAQQGGEQWININLIVTPEAQVGKWVDGLIVRKPIAGLAGATGRIKADNLAKVAQAPGVVSIRPFVREPQPASPVPPDAEKMGIERGSKGLLKRTGESLSLARTKSAESQANGQVGLTSHIGVDVMGARGAWELGFTGEGVIVGHLDSGCDFGHPDLEGTWAVVSDTESPYNGWPMVYDAGPALLYVAYEGQAFSWETVWDPTSLVGLYSYYVDTSATPEVTVSAGGITATAVITTVGYSDPPDYETPAVLSHVYTFANSSKSGVYHAGIHPESYLTLFNEPGEYVAVLAVDENVAGVYDTVYVDWGGNHSFDSWERFSKEHPTGWYYDTVDGSWSRDVTGDGVADVSAGILYWIADGENFVPGTDVVYYPEDLTVPGSGDLVLFYGDYNGASHGTGTAAAVCAQSVITGTTSAGGVMIPTWANVEGGVVRGAAPDAKLFSSNLFSVGTTDIDSWYVHALGYDGVPGTGDEAQIDTNSWGWTGWADAWSNESRVMTQLGATFPRTTWFVGTGNGGTGYGTSSAPGTAVTAIEVGAIDLNGTVINNNEMIASRDQVLYGDITPYSSRGPDTAGRGDVNVVGIGDGATGDMPLLLSVATSGTVDGQLAWEEFGGTSQATPFVAGIGALTAQAYQQAHGSWPTYAQLRQILMSTAEDTDNDPFVQGAGKAEAKEAVQVAANLAGFSVSPPRWNAGNYRGVRIPEFASLVQPGSSVAQTFTVYNTSAVTETLQISDSTLLELGVWETVLTTTVSAEEPTRNFSKPDYLLPVYLKDGVNHIPEGTDLMVVRVASPWDKFSLGDATNPYSQTVDSLWYMKVLNWTDLNENGVLWNDTNQNGAVNNGELDNPPVTDMSAYQVSSAEINEFNLSYAYGTAKESRITQPLERSDDGIYIGLIHYTSPARQISKPIPVTPLNVSVYFYKQMDVSWLASSKTELTISPMVTGTFVSTVTIPANQAPGLYEATLNVKGQNQEANIPVVANVPAKVSASNLNFNFGGQNPTGAIYDNSYVYGGFDWLGNGWDDQGDWRMYFADVPDDLTLPAGSVWLVDTTWQSERTDIDTRVLGPTPNFYSNRSPNIFGPYTLDFIGGSVDTVYDREAVYGWGGNGYAWQTNTDGPREIVAAPVITGLNAIELQNVLFGGIDTRERFTGTVGTASLTPYPINISTEEIGGSLTLTFTASIDLPGLGYGGSFGLSKPMSYLDQPIKQNESKYFRFEVGDSASLELTLGTKNSATAPDLDLSLYQAIGGQWVRVARSAGATADEYIRMVRPPAGRYLAAVEGYTVVGTGTFDLSIFSIEGDDLTLTGIPSGPIEAGQSYRLTLHYQKPQASGTYYGLLLLGTDVAPAIINVPVTVNFQTPSLVGSTKMVQPEVTVGENLEYTIVATNQGTVTGTVSIVDYLPQSDVVTLLTETLTATMGVAVYEPTANDGYGVISWDGQLAAGETITITFEMATSDLSSTAGAVITNTVVFSDGVNADLTVHAVSKVNPLIRYLPLLMKK